MPSSKALFSKDFIKNKAIIYTVKEGDDVTGASSSGTTSTISLVPKELILQVTVIPKSWEDSTNGSPEGLYMRIK